MITAIDTNILIDVIAQHEASIDALASAATEGQLVISEVVYTELSAGLSKEMLEGLCKDFGIELVRSSTQALYLAGQVWKKYRVNNKSHERVVADFMIAAHAKCHADRLLTEDRGFYKNYFKDLSIISRGK